MDMVRQGITLYGLHPAHMSDCYKDFEPVMTVKSTVSFVKSLPAGATIGYGRTYTLSRPSVIATVPVGYATASTDVFPTWAICWLAAAGLLSWAACVWIR